MEVMNNMELAFGRFKIATEEERNEIYKSLGYNFDSDGVEAEEHESEANTELIKMIHRDVARKEMIAYLISEIQKEFNVEDDNEALLKWDDYKIKHGIDISLNLDE